MQIMACERPVVNLAIFPAIGHALLIVFDQVRVIPCLPTMTCRLRANPGDIKPAAKPFALSASVHDSPTSDWAFPDAL